MSLRSFQARRGRACRVRLAWRACLVGACFGAGSIATASPVGADVAPQQPAVAATRVEAGDSAPAAGRRTAADAVVVRVVEDDNVRIEESRVRGQLRRVVVQSKVGGVRPYEIIVGPVGRDPSQDRGAAGQRAWSLLDF